MALEGAEGATDQNKQALLNAITQQQGVGAQAYQNEANVQQQAHSAAVNQIAQQTTGAPAGLYQQLAGEQNALQGIYNTDRSLAQGAFNAAMQGTRDLNAAYFNQARAAVPALRAQAEGQVRLIQEQIAAERAERELAAQLQREEAALRREEMALAREQIQAETDARGGMSQTEADAFTKAVDDRHNKLYGDLLTSDPSGTLAGLYQEAAEFGDLESATAYVESQVAAMNQAYVAEGQPPMSAAEVGAIMRTIIQHFTLGPDPGDDWMDSLSPDGPLYASYVPQRAAASRSTANQALARDRTPRRRPSGTAPGAQALVDAITGKNRPRSSGTPDPGGMRSADTYNGTRPRSGGSTGNRPRNTGGTRRTQGSRSGGSTRRRTGAQ